MANTKITADVIEANAVLAVSIADENITSAKLADLAVTEGKIANSAITAGKIATDAVITAKIQNGAITSAKLDTNIAVGGTLTVGSHLLMGDNDIIKLGAGTDLQIYHDGSASIITDVGTGDLRLLGNNLKLGKSDNSATYLYATENGSVELYYAGAKKLETTSGGIDVTGTATMDGLTVDGTTSVVATLNTSVNGSQLLFNDATAGTQPWNCGIKNDGTNDFLLYNLGAENLEIYTSGDLRQKIASNGDISFYEDTGTTAKFFWDASAESLGIGTTSVGTKLNIRSDASDDGILLEKSDGTDIARLFHDGTSTNARFDMFSGGSATVQIKASGDTHFSGGNVGIGTSSVIGKLNLHGGTGDTASQDVVQTFTRISSTGNKLAAKIRLDNYDTNHADLKFQVKTTASSAESDNYYTDAMTIQGTTGNVGIGTTSPAYNLHVEKLSASGNVDLLVKNTGTDGTSNTRIMSYVSGAGGDPKIGLGISGVRDYFFRIDNSDSDKLKLDTNGSDIVTIDISGNVGIGTASPTVSLDVYNGSGWGGVDIDGTSGGEIRLQKAGTRYGGMYANDSTGLVIEAVAGTNSMQFMTNSLERMRITSAGSVGINTTSPDSTANLHIKSNSEGTSGNAVVIIEADQDNNNETDNPRLEFWQDGRIVKMIMGYDDNDFQMVNEYSGQLEFGTANAIRMTIASGGQLFLFSQTSGAGNADLRYTTGTGAVTYDTSSRLVKAEIEDIPYGLSTVMALSPKRYQRTDSDNKLEVGFIADEVVEVVPELVGMMEKRFLTMNQEDTEMVAGSVEYNKMTAVLVKAIQEQQALIEAQATTITDLTTRLETLENA
jgi:uncharacterized protein YaiE (UPF0345 family)